MSPCGQLPLVSSVNRVMEYTVFEGQNESETPTQQPASEPIEEQPQQSASQSQSAPVQQPQFMGEESSAARKFEDATDNEGIVMIRDQMSEFWGQTLKQIRFINEIRKRINEQGAEIKTLKDTTTAQAAEIEKLKAADTGKVSSQTDIICVQGYNVKKSVASILESIFNKHGDIAAECVFKPVSMRSSFLEIVCEVVGRIQTNNDIDNIEEIEQQVLATEAANINVSWL
ncbi:uncharacterized protein LOC110932990 [Helianthus annuus]|uniref:uncharacterized protein LOC110932990 n=1 Tax=Helianthus annuus TaxID=4232 RepID=UPI000B8FAB82|nr:uncharacterized protein LOC110932990 [Helianthus annuus]